MDWRHIRISLVTILCLAAAMPGVSASVEAAGTDQEAAEIAVRYAEAMATGQTEAWAERDLGCLSRMKAAQQAGGKIDQSALNRRCWTDTLAAHRTLVEDKPELGILGANKQDTGFGLLAPRHRSAAKWKTYPPAVFVSPAVLGATAGPRPVITLQQVTPAEPIALTQSNGPLTTVPGTMVELAVDYPDAFTAPLALAPDEVWWARGTVRRYQPVQRVLVRFVVAGELDQHGYPGAWAVVNEALADSPQIAATSYGMRATEDALQPPVRGQFVLGSARWWTRESAKDQYAAAMARLEQLSSDPERRALLVGLLRVDPTDANVSGLLGDVEFRTFVREGLAKGKIEAKSEEAAVRAGEIYWNFQAQTWRQELTEVAQGHSAAAEAFYGAMRGMEGAVAGGTATAEQRSRLGMLYRWNNNVEEALELHEALLRDTPEQEHAARARRLSEVAWDRLQWVNWNRRYDHPWLAQAQAEARQALVVASDPVDQLMAAEVLLVAESLSFERTPATVQARVQEVKARHEQVTQVSGLWPYLIGNDMVKSLVPASEQVTLPVTPRSDEVVDVRVHARVPKQDIIRKWDFDTDPVGSVPSGFTAMSGTGASEGAWRVEPFQEAVSAPHVLRHGVTCQTDSCLSLMAGETVDFAFPDATVQLMVTDQQSEGGAGIAMWARDGQTAYAVVLNPTAKQVKFYRVHEGKIDVLATESVRLGKSHWHSLRVQRVNYAHVSRPRLAAYVDGHQVSITPEDVIPAINRVGLAVLGKVAADFDSFHLIDMITNRPLSSPAAY